jgi:hypothetical protein
MTTPLFMALKDAHSGASWLDWEDDLRLRDAAALDAARRRFDADVRFYQFVQFPVPPPMGRAQAVRQRTRDPDRWRHAHLRLARQRRCLGQSPNLPPLPGRSPVGRGRRPPGRLLRRRSALGQPALRLAGQRRERLRLVGRPRPRLARPGGSPPDRPFSGLRCRLGRASRRGHGGGRALGTGAGLRRLRRAPFGPRRPALHRRRPRRDHAGCGGLARGVEPPRG